MPTAPVLIAASFTSLFLSMFAGCASSNSARPQPDADSRAALPALTTDGAAVGWVELRPFLAEAAGGIAIEELVLTKRLRALAADEGVVVDNAAIERERRALFDSLKRAGATDDNEAEALVRQLQRTRSMGPKRLHALLDRNALLRALVQPIPEASAADIEREIDVLYGPKARIRIVVLGSASEAGIVRNRARQADVDNRVRVFTEEAVRSLDESAVRGGLLGDISVRDELIAESVRSAASRLMPGDVSPVVGVEGGYAVLYCEASIPPSPQPPDVSIVAAETIRSRRERAAMDDLARRVLVSSPVTVFDPELAWSWRQRTGNDDR